MTTPITATAEQFRPNIMLREEQHILESWTKRLAADPSNPVVQAAMLSIDRLLMHITYLENILRSPENYDE